jgi:hypothetical protein
MFRLSLSVILFGSALAADGPLRDVSYRTMNSCPGGGCLSAVFDRGYLIEMKAGGYTLWNPEGDLLYQTSVTAPDGTPASVKPPAIDADGTAAVPISYGAGQGRLKGAGIALIDRAGKQTQFIDTARWAPTRLCFAPDHSIWAMGTQFAPVRDDVSNLVDRGDYRLIRRYTRDGNLTGEFLPRSLFVPGLPPAAAGQLRASSGRIGIMLYPGDISNNPEWVELDLEGTLVGRWPLGPQSTADPVTHNMTYQLAGVSFTADGRLFAQQEHCPQLHHCSYQVAMLDRATATWRPAPSAAALPKHSYLIGAEGANLVFENRTQGVHLFWIPSGQGR